MTSNQDSEFEKKLQDVGTKYAHMVIPRSNTDHIPLKEFKLAEDGPILAIDPGNTHSGYALVEPGTCRPIKAGKIPNADVLDLIKSTEYDRLSIEMIASYGMAVGKEVFDTCVWIGRFLQHHEAARPAIECRLVYRREVKLHHCHTAKAKDSNITQALIDRFAYGQPNRGKGTKAEPGWFHGFAADIWQAYALAVQTADTINTKEDQA